jgi:hypothetical protein
VVIGQSYGASVALSMRPVTQTPCDFAEFANLHIAEFAKQSICKYPLSHFF